MILAVPYHLSRGETSAIGVPLFLGALAAFVAVGRLRKVPIAARA
jgi:putative oxidoreductase